MEGDQIPQPLYTPGQQVQPGGTPSPVVEPEPAQPAPQPTPPAAPSPQPAAPAPQAPAQQPQAPAPQQAVDDGNSISWTASEYIHHQKQAGWYMGLLALAILLAAVLFITQHDFTAPIVIILAAAALWVFGARKPRTLNYRITASGVSIEDKNYSYDKFRSFSVVDDGEVPSLLLSPLQRFVPPISIYYDFADEDKIVGAISQFLPHEDRDLDSIDRLSRRLKF